MSITGKVLYNKIHGLRPDVSSGITSEILSKLCDDVSAQPFLEWFCKNVSSANILSNEEIKLKNVLEESGEWLEGEALEATLEEAIEDCPDLFQLDSIDDTEDLLAEYEEFKESCREDEEYLCLLPQSIKNLKQVQNKTDDDIEEAEIMLDKERIETEKVYDDCSAILKEYEKENRQLSNDVDVLLKVYTDAAQNQGRAILWSQIPIDLFVKQIELYNHYLKTHIKKQFGDVIKEEDSKDSLSDYGSLISDSRDKQVDEKMHELYLCKTNLTNSKLEEINAKIQEESYTTMLECVQNIYDGNIKVPRDSALCDEIQQLSSNRDCLEQNIELLSSQQIPQVIQFAEMEIIKIQKNDALARLERRKARLEKLENLHFLAGKHGHVYVDLLCILMEMQSRRLHEVAEFVADARHYITTEYKLSSKRSEIMQQLQDEYTTLTTSFPNTYNVFNQIFISMMLGDNSDGTMSSALKKYDDLLADNVEKKKLLVEKHLNNKICKLRDLDDEISKHYAAETHSGPTISLRPVSYEMSTKCEEVSADVEKLQEDITRIKNQFKERMRMDTSLEREKDILWQRFLADPDTLRMKYKNATEEANASHFGGTSSRNFESVNLSQQTRLT